MEKNLLQRLQKVKLQDLFHIFLFLAAIIPAVFIKRKRKIWLVSEVPKEARDNGYWFFKYTREHHPDRDILYAIRKDAPDYEKVAVIGKTVNYGSYRHWVYYLACSAKISSQKSGRPNDAVCYLLDRLGMKKKEVFLQHGVIKDNLPYIHADKAKFCLFTTSTEKEYQYVKENFGFSDGIIQKLGLCRFDDLHSAQTEKKLILIMPTWRQWIANPDLKTKNAESFQNFEQTEYFSRWNSLLNSKELENLLKKHGMKAVFYPHRHMQQYINSFSDNSCQLISTAAFPEADVHQMLKSAAVLITDYSSVAMDFAYMGKPVIYYQFDYDRFRKHHLPESYYSYQEDGFGPIATGCYDVINELSKTIQDNCQMQDLYKNRADSFFDLKDTDNCRRTYEAVASL